MFTPAELRDLIGGKKRGLSATLARGVLSTIEPFYGLGVWWRNRRYDRGSSPVARVDVPVVSVGNITVGGTGKTPLVEWLARWYRARGVRVALVSRGYGAEEGAKNDEALELEQRLPDVPHVQNPDRVVGARTAIDELDCQLILLDDGFQHRRLARDLDIVLIDALLPFGYDHLLPRGLLREPLAGLNRAHVVALSRADMVSAERREQIRSTVLRYAPDVVWVELAHRPQALISCDCKESQIGTLRERRVAAFCGIGNPDGFRQTLRACHLEVVDLREFPDHHPYTRTDLDDLGRWISHLDDLEAVVCTYKDLVKIGADRLGPHPLWALKIGIEVLTGSDQFESQLERVSRDCVS